MMVVVVVAAHKIMCLAGKKAKARAEQKKENYYY
jgi:hypothetical protein